jgi:hypothetical protein
VVLFDLDLGKLEFTAFDLLNWAPLEQRVSLVCGVSILEYCYRTQLVILVSRFSLPPASGVLMPSAKSSWQYKVIYPEITPHHEQNT